MNITTDRKQIVIVSTSALQDLSGVRNRTGKSEDHALFFSPDVELLVVTTRVRLGDHDNWWQEFVSDKNIFGLLFAGEIFYDLLGPSLFEKCISSHIEQNPFYPAGWHHLYNHLGLDWPIDEDRVDVHWIDAACHLQSLGYHVRW